MNQDQQTYDYLSQFLTERKRDLFDSVVSRRTRKLVLVLEDIYQAMNSSAILRSCESCGIQDVYIAENHHAFMVRRRIAKGAAQWLTLHRYHADRENSAACFHELKSRGYRIIVASAREGALPMDQLDIHGKIALVMGTELSGVSSIALEVADAEVTIPMSGFTESLNVSAAASILLYQLSTRIRNGTEPWNLSADEQLELKLEWAKTSVKSSEYILDTMNDE